MDGTRVKALARLLLADVLSVGSVMTAGPAVTPQQEASILDALESRVRDMLTTHGHESDAKVAERFRKAHPELFKGDIHERHRAASNTRK